MYGMTHYMTHPRKMESCSTLQFMLYVSCYICIKRSADLTVYHVTLAFPEGEQNAVFQVHEHPCKAAFPPSEPFTAMRAKWHRHLCFGLAAVNGSEGGDTLYTSVQVPEKPSFMPLPLLEMAVP